MRPYLNLFCVQSFLRIFLILLFFTFNHFLVQAQSWKIDEGLMEIIDANPDKIIEILIEFDEKADFEALKDLFEKEEIDVSKRPEYVIRELQNIAHESQIPLMEWINNQALDPNFRVHSFWIINRVMLKLKAELVLDLSYIENIKNIKIEKGKILSLEPVKNSENSDNRKLSSIEPGLPAINAPKMWAMGYTGRGRLVYNYDTGVWPDHPSFSSRFLANRYPMSQSWLGYYRDFPNGFIHNHGTHTLGTILGLDPVLNDTIGVAHQAYWMANDYVGTTVESLPPLEDMIYAFEWALNPDGDITTNYDVPEVINNSWRWSDEPTQEHCESFIVDLMNAIETAGIANVFSGGNAGPNNTSISSPQRINTSVVNTFSVGSIDANQNAPYPISSFSSRGPTQCNGEGSLKIHPQVVAPGQNVRSAWGIDSYNSISGTSMACPHVSGAVLLLKEAYPFLTGEELLWALYETAIDYGEVGEDNTFGNGLIDVYAAFLYLKEQYEPINPKQVDHDLAINGISNIGDLGIVCDPQIDPVMELENKGDSSITDIFIEYWFTDYGDTISETASLTLLGGEIINYQMSIPELLENGNYELNARVSILKEGLIEYDEYNNRFRTEFLLSSVKELPFFEDFENGFDESVWVIHNPDIDISWDTIPTGGLEENFYSASMQFYKYSPRAGQKDRLILANLKIPDDSIAYLTYNWSYQPFLGSQTISDTLRIIIQDQCRIEDEQILLEKAGESLYVNDTISINFKPKHPWQWKKDTVSLENFDGKNISVVFEGTNMKWNNLYIDNIRIGSKIMSAQKDVIIDGDKLLLMYPNPTDDKLFFKVMESNMAISEVGIYNETGTMIQSFQNVNKSNFEIEISNLIPGIYIIVLQGKNQVFRKKFIKM